MADEYFIPIYCILPKKCVVKEIFISEWRICLAVSPALKAYGIPGRARLFEVVRKVKEINDERKRKNGGHEFTGQSCDTGELKADRSFALDYITAVPRMALYMKYSTRIYDI